MLKKVVHVSDFEATYNSHNEEESESEEKKTVEFIYNRSTRAESPESTDKNNNA